MMQIKVDDQGNKRCVADKDFRFLHPEDCPPPKNTKVLLETKYGTILIGHWNENDCSGWFPLPRKAIKQGENCDKNSNNQEV